MLYQYDGQVGIPALEMVDDIADVKKCGIDSVKSNAVVNVLSTRNSHSGNPNAIKFTLETKVKNA